MIKNLKKKIEGYNFGATTADALGYPIEFLNIKEIYNLHGKNGPKGNPEDFIKNPNGSYQYSDDTQRIILTEKSLLENKSKPYNVKNIMDSFTEYSILWFDDPENNRAPGISCMNSCKRLKRGIHWSQSGEKNSKGNGAAMSSGIIGAYFLNDLEKMTEVSTAMSKSTHKHPTGIVSGVLSSYLVNLAIKGENPENLVEKSLEFINNFGKKYSIEVKEVELKLHEVKRFQKYNLIKGMGLLGRHFEGKTGEEAVAMALYSFIKSPNDFKSTILNAINIGGDSDTVGCIAGGISGAYNGIESIPFDWRNNIENKEGLEKLANEIYETLK